MPYTVEDVFNFPVGTRLRFKRADGGTRSWHMIKVREGGTDDNEFRSRSRYTPCWSLYDRGRELEDYNTSDWYCSWSNGNIWGYLTYQEFDGQVLTFPNNIIERLDAYA